MSLVHILDFEFQNLKYIIDIYDQLDIKQKDIFTFDECNFNNYIGDVTKDIVWTWGINDFALKLFDWFFNELKLIDKLNKIYSNRFYIKGISFITLNKKKVTNEESNFHYDILSPYDNPKQTNILTVIIPIKFKSNMGGLQYIEGKKMHNYNYKLGELIVFDSSKIEHRTMPFELLKEEYRVLLSINLSSDLEWASCATKKVTLLQGNI